MIGREKEVSELNAIYDRDEAQFVAVYGRRQEGKTHSSFPEVRVHE